MCPLRSLELKPSELNAQPMPFRLGKHFEVAILLRVHQGHHRHTAQCRPGGGEALRLERLEARGEAKIRQELALEGVAHGGEPVPVAQPHEGREVPSTSLQALEKPAFMFSSFHAVRSTSGFETNERTFVGCLCLYASALSNPSRL